MQTHSILTEKKQTILYNQIYISHFSLDSYLNREPSKQPSKRFSATLFLIKPFFFFSHSRILLFQINCKDWIQFRAVIISSSVAMEHAYIFRLLVMGSPIVSIIRTKIQKSAESKVSYTISFHCGFFFCILYFLPDLNQQKNI